MSVDLWSAMAPGWIRHADRQDALGEPLGACAMTALAPSPGERIVDIGCGCGGTTEEIASRAGSALGVDISAEMVAAARVRFPGTDFATVDVEAVDRIAGGPFDAAYSRMALMLFADPVAGLSAVRRSLRSGGRLAATVFRGQETNQWLISTVLGAAPHLGPLPALPLGDEAGPFAFASAERTTKLLAAAGFQDIVVTARDVVVATPDNPSIVEWLIEIGPAGLGYRAAAPEAQAAARAGVVSLLRRFHTPGEGYRLPAGVWLITAVAP